MNYEKYLTAAGVDDPELRQQALEYLAKCEKDYSRHRIAWHKAAAWIVVGWLLLRGKVPFEAEAHRLAMEASDAPQYHDFSTGWPTSIEEEANAAGITFDQSLL